MLQYFRKGSDMTGQPIFNSGSHIGFAACDVAYLRVAMKRRQAKKCESIFAALYISLPECRAVQRNVKTDCMLGSQMKSTMHKHLFMIRTGTSQRCVK